MKNSISPLALYNSLYNHPNLIWQLTKREVIGRYRGSILGIFWSFMNPLFMLMVYTFFFSIIYQARWNIQTGNKFDFALILFAGLIPYQFFSECLNKAPMLILTNVNYVKKVVFPLQILPWVQLGSAFFHMLISFSVLLLAWVLLHGSLHWTAILFPIVNLPLLFFTLGLVWFLAAIGVYFRDIIQTIGIITTALLFLSPIFYSIQIIPEPYRQLIYLNPLTTIIEQNRDILIYGHIVNIESWILSLSASLCIAWLGFFWFQKTRNGFADVL